MKRLTMGLAATAIGITTPVWAADGNERTSESSFERLTGVGALHAGGGTAYGFFGLSVQYSPLAYLAVEGGLGYGYSGLQIVADVHVRAPIGNFAPFASLGVSVTAGGLSDPEGQGGGEVRDVTWPVWLNVMAGIEYRWDAGFEVRLYGGWTQVVASSTCEREESECTPGSPGGGLALGVAF